MRVSEPNQDAFRLLLKESHKLFSTLLGVGGVWCVYNRTPSSFSRRVSSWLRGLIRQVRSRLICNEQPNQILNDFRRKLLKSKSIDFKLQSNVEKTNIDCSYNAEVPEKGCI